MSFQHPELAHGRWHQLPLVDQMANIGSEVGRAIKWRRKQKEDYSRMAAERALELLSLSLDDPKLRKRLRELTRLYEVLVDYFFGENTYRTTDISLERYFNAFNHAARIHR
jgi:hypothetical protein